MEATAKNPDRYKVFFHCGDELTVKTRAMRGVAWIDRQGLHVNNETHSFVIQGCDIGSFEMFRLHGLGRVVRVDHRGGRLFLSVVRLMIGQFALINFFKTGVLREQIAALSQERS